MNPLSDQLNNFSDIGVAIHWLDALQCLGLSFLLSVVVAKVYQFSYRGVAYSPAFMHTLVMCSMVITAVMLVIGTNIARAFSLVGALSIIRFRNAVKDPRDVAFIFLSMGVGMACGTMFYWIAFVLTAAVCGAVIALTVCNFGSQGTTERLIKIQAPAAKNFERLFDDVLRKFTLSFSLVSVESSRMGTEVELLFSTKVKEPFSAERLISELSSLNENLRIQVLGSNHVVDL